MGLLSCFANIGNSTLAKKQLLRKTEKIAIRVIFIFYSYRHSLNFAVNVDIGDPGNIKTAKILT